MEILSYILAALELHMFQNKLKNSEEKNITNVYRIQGYNSITCRHFVWDFFILC